MAKYDITKSQFIKSVKMVQEKVMTGRVSRRV